MVNKYNKEKELIVALNEVVLEIAKGNAQDIKSKIDYAIDALQEFNYTVYDTCATTFDCDRVKTLSKFKDFTEDKLIDNCKKGMADLTAEQLAYMPKLWDEIYSVVVDGKTALLEDSKLIIQKTKDVFGNDILELRVSLVRSSSLPPYSELFKLISVSSVFKEYNKIDMVDILTAIVITRIHITCKYNFTIKGHDVTDSIHAKIQRGRSCPVRVSE